MHELGCVHKSHVVISQFGQSSLTPVVVKPEALKSIKRRALVQVNSLASQPNSSNLPSDIPMATAKTRLRSNFLPYSRRL